MEGVQKGHHTAIIERGKLTQKKKTDADRLGEQTLGGAPTIRIGQRKGNWKGAKTDTCEG